MGRISEFWEHVPRPRPEARGNLLGWRQPQRFIGQRLHLLDGDDNDLNHVAHHPRQHRRRRQRHRDHPSRSRSPPAPRPTGFCSRRSTLETRRPRHRHHLRRPSSHVLQRHRRQQYWRRRHLVSHRPPERRPQHGCQRFRVQHPLRHGYLIRRRLADRISRRGWDRQPSDLLHSRRSVLRFGHHVGKWRVGAPLPHEERRRDTLCRLRHDDELQRHTRRLRHLGILFAGPINPGGTTWTLNVNTGASNKSAGNYLGGAWHQHRHHRIADGQFNRGIRLRISNGDFTGHSRDIGTDERIASTTYAASTSVNMSVPWSRPSRITTEPPPKTPSTTTTGFSFGSVNDRQPDARTRLGQRHALCQHHKVVQLLWTCHPVDGCAGQCDHKQLRITNQPLSGDHH